jgi:ElaB/YqjD/DUF883 family membrane-anchored ribosome-binding protein
MTTAAATQRERTTEPCGWQRMESLGENVREMRRAATAARHAAEDAVAETALNIRRYPFRSVGAGIGLGIVAGVLIGFGVGRCQRERR